MRKFISLAVALAMVISVCPMFGLTASAAAETPYVLFDAASAIKEGDYHGDIELNKYRWTTGSGGVKFSTQWSEAGTWDVSPWGEPALMFFREQTEKEGTDEIKSATIDNADITEGATRIVIEFKFAMQTDKDNYQYWYFKDLDGKTFAQLHYDKNGPCDAGITSPAEYAKDSAAAQALRGTSMKIEAVEGESDWTVTYTSGSDVVCTEKVGSINGFKGIEANVKEWCKQYKAMGLMGLKITADVNPANIAHVTVKTELSDGVDSGVDDISFDVRAGKEYTYVPKSTSAINVDGTYYIYSEADSTLTINPKAEGENVIKLHYNKYDGTGYTGSAIADGATCWFADPRTLTVKNEDGTVNYTYIGYIDNYGNIKATQYDNNTKDYEEVLVRSNIQPDDHNNPAFLELPDHHIMIIYSRHTDEACFYYRISKEPYDITTLAAEKRLDTNHNTTYPNPFILSDDPDHIYMGWRGVGWHPTLAQLAMPTEENDYTLSYTWGPKQVVQSYKWVKDKDNKDVESTDGMRPYAKYATNGKDEIWIAYTYSHPQNGEANPNWLFFNRFNIKTKDLMAANGDVISNVDKEVYQIHKNTGNGSFPDKYKAFAIDTPTDKRDWLWEVAVDDSDPENPKPVVATVRISGDQTKHDYGYAVFTGSEWQYTDLPDPEFNTQFHTSNTEHCYSGGMSIDKADPHVVYASVPVDGVFGRVWEIVKYTLSEDYSTVTDTTYITKDSIKNNARPYVANGSEEGDLRLTWFNGDYYYWVHSNQYSGQGYPVTMMTLTTLDELPVNNQLDSGDGEVKSLLTNTELAPAPADGSFTISVNLLQNDIGDEGTLLESGDLKIELKKQTVDTTHNYNAVAPQITVGETVEKSQNMFSDASWYFSHSGTDGSKGEASLSWINYVVTYDADARELVTYVNGLIDATIQDVDVNLGETITAPGGLLAVAADVRTADAALTQAEVRAAIAEFDKDAAQVEAEEIFDNFDYDMLEIPTETVTDLILPAKTNGGAAITWTSNDADVISNDGVVTRDGEAHEVVLTAEFGEKTKDFTVTVPAKVNVMEENMILHYDFNDVTGNVVEDLSGNGYDAELNGSAKITDGKLDLTANVANTENPDAGANNGYLNVPYDFMKDVRSYSVVEMISGGSDRKDPRLYDFGKNTGNSVFTRLNTVGGNNQYQAGLKYNGGGTQMVSGKPFVTGEYWLVTTYSAATGETKIYTVNADGIKTVANGTDVKHEPYEISGSTDRNYIGRTQWSVDSGQRVNNQDFNGTIDNFMFFNTALTEDEIKAVTALNITAEPSLRITTDADGKATLGIAFTVAVNGLTTGATDVGFEYSVNGRDESGNYTVTPENPEDKPFGEKRNIFRLSISGISAANSARTYTVKPYVLINGEKVYGEAVSSSLYGVLVDSIVNAEGTTIPTARLTAANGIVSFVKQNKKDNSEAKFPLLGDAWGKLYDADGAMVKKAVNLGIKDDAEVEPQLAEALSLEAVEIEFFDTDVEEVVTNDITADFGIVDEL